MSGGNGGGGRSGRAKIGVDINPAAAKTGIRSAPSPNGAVGKPGGGLGERKTAAAAAPAPVAPSAPPVPGASGAGSGTDIELTQGAARLATVVPAGRKRLARGGGLSNLMKGGATLG